MRTLIKSRDLGTPTLAMTAGVTFAVEKYSRHCIGGPEEATIAASGSVIDLCNLLDMVRCPVEITDDHGALTWWGFISQVEVRFENVVLTADIDDMYNAVAVAFTTVGAGEASTGTRDTTAWAEDEISIAEFGRRELLDSIGGTTALHAVISRDRTLERQKYPHGVAEINSTDDSENAPSATLTCAGWWSTVEWLYAEVPTKLAFAYSTMTAAEHTLGRDYADDGQNITALAQAFDTGATAWNLLEVAVYLKKTGNPSGTLSLALYTNPDDTDPGDSLASVTIAAAEVSTSGAWTRGTFSGAELLDPNSTYYLVVNYSGTPDADNYYTVRLDGDHGYAAGALRKKVASTWSADPADMPFRLYTDTIIRTSQQIRSMLVNFGQFFRNVYVGLDSGISTESYKNGDSDARFEIEELLEIGTNAGLRMLADVDANRNVRVFEEPGDDDSHFLEKSGHFYYLNQPLDDAICPVGFWARLRNVLPGGASISRLSGLDRFFVERCEYDAQARKLRFETADKRDPLDLGEKRG
jgi:hypothetical protein